MGGFWEVFGVSLGCLGALLGPSFSGFVAKRVQEAAERSLGLDSDWIWEGFGRGLGGFWVSKSMFFWLFLHILLKITKDGIR